MKQLEYVFIIQYVKELYNKILERDNDNIMIGIQVKYKILFYVLK